MIAGNGAGAVQIIDDGRIQGRFVFTSATGPITVTVNSGDDALLEGWHTEGTTTFGSGADTINNTADGTIAARVSSATFNFGAGADTFNNAGRLIVGGMLRSTPSFGAVGSLTLTNLETFNNSGLIVLGAVLDNADDGWVSDGQGNDTLTVNGGTFTGSGDSRIALDVYLDALTKDDCSAPNIGDCVVFNGATTAGTTLLTITNGSLSQGANDIFNQNPVPGTPVFNSGITIIEGASAADNFILDPNMPGYVQTDQGGMLDVGLVSYRLDYDADTKRHMLVSSLPSTAGAQSVTATAEAQEVWHETTGSWFTRQADLRATPGGLQSSHGLWARIATTGSDRDVDLNAVGSDSTRSYAFSAKQRTSQLVFGGDVLSGSGADSAWVLGVMLGAVRADVDHDVTNSELIYSGVTGGVYGSYVAGPLFIDALVNANFLDAEAEVAGIDPTGLDKLNSNVKSVGGQIEAGWRLPVAANVSLEPLLAVSYVTTKLSEMKVGALDVHYDFDSAKSLRTGAGLRGAFDTQLAGVPATFSLTGRYWNESEGEGSVRLVMPTGEASIASDLPGSFSEIDAGLNLFSPSGGVSGFVNVGGKFGDDYKAMNASVGVRMRW
jgi:hypothetical protein